MVAPATYRVYRSSLPALMTQVERYVRRRVPYFITEQQAFSWRCRWRKDYHNVSRYEATLHRQITYHHIVVMRAGGQAEAVTSKKAAPKGLHCDSQKLPSKRQERRNPSPSIT